MKKWIAMGLSVLLLAGCAGTSSSSSASSASSAEPPAAPKNMHDEYPGVPEDNQFTYAEDTDAVIKMLEHGTGVVYLGFDECPFCQAYAPILNEVAEEAGVPVLYYDILEDREGNTDAYKAMVKALDGHLDFDNDGNPRIYVPDVSFIVNGEIIEHDNESSMLSSNEIKPERYWTAERREALKAKLSAAAKIVAEARKENDDKGCDKGCEYDPGNSSEKTDESAAALTAFLDQLDTEVHPGVMGSTIASISCAAGMMDWYLEAQPEEETIRSAVKEHLKNEDDVKAFRMSLEIVSYAAEDIASGEITAAQLQDAGYTKEIKWSKEDVQKLFSVLMDEVKE
ncbi:MAG: thioredoxin family protein [Solobacterium sp.]|nr:thioredoxin family protein [Solobacterium sp.]